MARHDVGRPPGGRALASEARADNSQRPEPSPAASAVLIDQWGSDSGWDSRQGRTIATSRCAPETMLLSRGDQRYRLISQARGIKDAWPETCLRGERLNGRRQVKVRSTAQRWRTWNPGNLIGRHSAHHVLRKGNVVGLPGRTRWPTTSGFELAPRKRAPHAC